MTNASSTSTESRFSNPAEGSGNSVAENGGSDTGTPKSGSEKPAVTPERIFRSQLSKYESTIVKLVSDNGMSLDKFVAVVENAVRKTPELLNCDRQTLFASILTSAEFGLEPNTPAQHCWIIPYNNRQKGIKEAQFQFGYHGIVELLYRNARILKIKTEVVYKNDQFDRWMDESMDWKFIFRPKDEERGDIRGIFAIVNIEGTEPEFKFMSIKELNEIRAKSKKPEMYNPSMILKCGCTRKQS